MWIPAFRCFWRDDSGATFIIVGAAMPTLFLAFSIAIEVAGAVDYRQRLIMTAELSCRQASLYLKQQATKPNRDAAAEHEEIRRMIQAQARALGVQTEPFPMLVAINNDRPTFELQGSYRFLMFDLSGLGVIQPRGSLACPNLAQAVAGERNRRGPDHA